MDFDELENGGGMDGRENETPETDGGSSGYFSGGYREYDYEPARTPPYEAQSWQRQEPTPMSKKQKKRGSGAWIILPLLLLAVFLAAGVAYLTRNIGVYVERDRNSFSLVIGPKRTAEEGKNREQDDRPSSQDRDEAERNGKKSQELIGGQARLKIVPSDIGAESKTEQTQGALSLQQIYSKMIASVVSITTSTQLGQSSGTGIIMSEDGYIITNAHVINGAYDILVFTSDEESYSAAVVGSDETSDLAVLKVEAQRLVPAEFGDSASLRVGDSVVAIGDPLGVQLRGTMTDGIVSAINRDLTVGDRKMTLIQTNAALNNGNSGGPLINCYGQVIGINTMKMSAYYTDSATVEGLGFAIPITVAKPIVDELIENGYVSGRPAIGITGESLPRSFQAYYRLPEGIYIRSVSPGSDAEEQGLSEGDIITAINGTQVSTIDELNTVKNQFSAGDTVTLTVFRGGEFYDLEIRLIDQATGK